MPPAFSQSAAFFAFVTSPAKAGPVKASAKANANVDTSVFTGRYSLRLSGGEPGELRSNASRSSQIYLPLRGAFWIVIPRNLNLVSVFRVEQPHPQIADYKGGNNGRSTNIREYFLQIQPATKRQADYLALKLFCLGSFILLGLITAGVL